MSELNREQIIKALECCTSEKGCTGCPRFLSLMGCSRQNMIDALSLIKELTEESQKWQEGYDCVDAACRELSSKCDELTEENERLRAENERCVVFLGDGDSLELVRSLPEELLGHSDPVGDKGVCGRYKQCQADTVRKMQTEIEARCLKGGIYPAFVERTIAKIAEEIIEGKTE